MAGVGQSESDATFQHSLHHDAEMLDSHPDALIQFRLRTASILTVLSFLIILLGRYVTESARAHSYILG